MNAPFYYRAPLAERAPSRDISKVPLEKQSLFESRARLRKMRILIDERTVPQTAEKPSDSVLNFFLQSDLVDVWYVNPPFPHVNDEAEKYDDLPNSGRVSVVETTGTLGPFAWRGTTYGYSYKEVYSGGESFVGGALQTSTPEEILLAAELGAGITTGSPELLKQVKIATALKEVAKILNADLLISNEYIGNEALKVILGNANFVSTKQAVSTLAHYFRTQGYFIAGSSPRRELDSDDYYLYAVYAYCPHIRHWTGKVDRAIEFYGDENFIHASYANTAISRCSRALRRYDDLLLYLGRPLSRTSIDDAIDAVDHILVSLCAAIDALARSISEALETGPRIPKLHDKKWIKEHFKPIYGSVPEYKQFQDLLPQIEFLFKIRNSIHSLGLMPYAEIHPLRSKELMRIQVVIPPTSKDSWEKMQAPAREAWGLKVSESVAHVDLLTFIQRCLEETFSFIDVLSEIISFEQVEDKGQVLFENMIKVEDQTGLEISAFIASTGFFDSPLLTGAYDPDGKRVLEVDEASARTQKNERLLRELGWKPRPDYTPLRQPPTITTYVGHDVRDA